MPLATRSSDDVPTATGERLIELVDGASRDGLRVEAGGLVIGNAQQGEVSSEGIGLLVAALVLLLTFGSVVAAGMPLATALFGLGLSSALGGILAALIDVPDWAPSVAAMIGIGVGIDYALLIVTRFRAALARGLEPREATMEAIATAGRSVLVAGSTVVVSMLGLFLMGLTYLYGVALSAIIAVLVVMASGTDAAARAPRIRAHRIDRFRIPGVRGSAVASDSAPAARWSRAIQRRPWVGRHRGNGGAAGAGGAGDRAPARVPRCRNDAAETNTRQAYDLMTEGFGAGSAGPMMLVADVRAAATIVPRSRRWRRACAARVAWRPCRSRCSTAPATRRSSRSSRAPRRRTKPPPTWSSGFGTTWYPPAGST